MSNVEFSRAEAIPDVLESAKTSPDVLELAKTKAVNEAQTAETALQKELDDFVIGEQKYDRIDANYSGRYTEIHEGTLSPLVAGGLLLHDPATSSSISENGQPTNKSYIEGVSVKEEGRSNGLTLDTNYMYNGTKLQFGMEDENGTITPGVNGTNIDGGDRGIADQKIGGYRLAKVPTGQGVEINPESKLRIILGDELYAKLEDKNNKIPNPTAVQDALQMISTARNADPKKSLAEICAANITSDKGRESNEIVLRIAELPGISDPSSFASVMENIMYLNEARVSGEKLYERVNYALILLKDNEFLDADGKIYTKEVANNATLIEKKDDETTNETETRITHNVSVLQSQLEAGTVTYADIQTQVESLLEELTNNATISVAQKDALIQQVTDIQEKYTSLHTVDVVSDNVTNPKNFSELGNSAQFLTQESILKSQGDNIDATKSAISTSLGLDPSIYDIEYATSDSYLEESGRMNSNLRSLKKKEILALQSKGLYIEQFSIKGKDSNSQPTIEAQRDALSQKQHNIIASDVFSGDEITSIKNLVGLEYANSAIETINTSLQNYGSNEGYNNILTIDIQGVNRICSASYNESTKTIELSPIPDFVLNQMKYNALSELYFNMRAIEKIEEKIGRSLSSNEKDNFLNAKATSVGVRKSVTDFTLEDGVHISLTSTKAPTNIENPVSSAVDMYGMQPQDIINTAKTIVDGLDRNTIIRIE